MFQYTLKKYYASSSQPMKIICVSLFIERNEPLGWTQCMLVGAYVRLIGDYVPFDSWSAKFICVREYNEPDSNSISALIFLIVELLSIIAPSILNRSLL